MNVTVLCILKDWKQLPLSDLSCHCCWCLRRWGVCYLQRHISHVWHSVIAVVIVIEIELSTACQVVLPEFSSWTLRCIFRTQDTGAVLRWWRNRTGRPLSPPQIHQKNIWLLSKFHTTTSECWQRTSGTQKSSPLSSKGDVLSTVLYRWRMLDATVKIRLKTRSWRLKSKSWEYQRTPDSREH